MTVVTLARPAMLAGLTPQPADALLRLIDLHRADPRAGKIDLGVGVYRDEAGATPVLRAVKKAEGRLLATQDSKSYLGAEGDMRFADLLATVAFGAGPAMSDRLTGVQTPGGTGALRLAAELIARAAPDATVWIGTPTWPNHAPIFQAAGLAVRPHAYFDDKRQAVDFDAMLASLDGMKAGDVLLLHGCCHNPTGAGFAPGEWAALTALIVRRGVMPVVDLAYQGLGDGLDADAAGMRAMLADVPEALVAYSCNKNFALYRERVGALWVLSSRPADVADVRSNMLVLARSLWSMPPDHGAAVVRLILEDPALTALWTDELDRMRARLLDVRDRLSRGHPLLAPVRHGRGLFALLPLDPAAIATLRQDHAIYMAGSGRINIAGLTQANVPAFLRAFEAVAQG